MSQYRTVVSQEPETRMGDGEDGISTKRTARTGRHAPQRTWYFQRWRQEDESSCLRLLRPRYFQFCGAVSIGFLRLRCSEGHPLPKGKAGAGVGRYAHLWHRFVFVLSLRRSLSGNAVRIRFISDSPC